MSNKKKTWIISILILLILSITYGVYIKIYGAGKIYVLSVSTDGNYAISTDLSRKAILWDLKNHKKKILDRTANIYSAYFIKNSDNFMWQHDTDNEVIIENTSGKMIKKFNPGFPTYGQVITSDLNNYFASDEDWNLFCIGKDKKKTQLSTDEGGFLGVQKLLTLQLLEDKNYLLSCGWGDPGKHGANYKAIKPPKNAKSQKEGLSWVILWNLTKKEPLWNFRGNVAQTIATLSPYGKYVVAGDVNSLGFVWNTKTGKKLFAIPSISGYVKKIGKDKFVWDNKGFIPIPQDFDPDKSSFGGIFAIKFIDNKHYLIFDTHVSTYAILYKVTNPKPLKYIKLGKPDISVDMYTRDQSIDTSPSAHILVTGKIDSGGILVYKYDPETQTLTKIWNGK